MYSFFHCRPRRRASVWEGLCAPRIGSRGVKPHTVAAVYDRRLDHGGHRPPLQPTSGFTLLELLIVLTLLGILTSLVIGVARRAAESARTARTHAELVALTAALDSYKLSYGEYPRTDLSARLLQSLIGKRGPTYLSVTGPSLIDAARFNTGGMMDPFTSEAAELLDPWSRPYRYAYRSQMPWSNPVYVLYSVGPDGNASATLLSGGYPDYPAAGNVDNIYANR